MTTASPLLLNRCDEVVFSSPAGWSRTGTHRELLAATPAYRETVTRGEAG